MSLEHLVVLEKKEVLHKMMEYIKRIKEPTAKLPMLNAETI